MQTQRLFETQQNNFELKHQAVNLIAPKFQPKHSELSLASLEAMRVASGPLSASKHGLEVICGASCETGAQ